MPAKETVIVGCRLPQGLVLHHPVDRNIQVTLDGPKLVVADGRKLSSNYATTEVDADFWALWKEAYSKSPIMLSRAIFEAKNPQEAAAKAKELAKEKTGFEQMSQTAGGVEKSTSAN
jgi:hypothetical protein